MYFNCNNRVLPTHHQIHCIDIIIIELISNVDADNDKDEPDKSDLVASTNIYESKLSDRLIFITALHYGVIRIISATE